MDKIYNRIRRLLTVAMTVATNDKHPKNRAFQISFVGLFVLLLLKSGVWQLCSPVQCSREPKMVFQTPYGSTMTEEENGSQEMTSSDKEKVIVAVCCKTSRSSFIGSISFKT